MFIDHFGAGITHHRFDSVPEIRFKAVNAALYAGGLLNTQFAIDYSTTGIIIEIAASKAGDFLSPVVSLTVELYHRLKCF